MSREVVHLCVPAKAEYFVAVRLVAGSIFGQAGYDMDDIEDAKTAISEACLLLMPQDGNEAEIQLDIWVEDGVHAVVSTQAAPVENADSQEREFSMFLLEALTDTVEFSTAEGRSAYRLYKAKPV